MTDHTASIRPDASRLHDPGGKVRLELPDGVRGEAQFSPCGRYRQARIRDWTATDTAPRTIFFIGQNPSVADAEVSDPTCHKELGMARRWGYTRYLKANMLDWRATSPRDVPKDPAIACSPANITAILEMAAEAETLVLAYGRLHPRYQPVVTEVIARLRGAGHGLHCLGLNKDGSAKHPLYLRNDTPLRPFPTG